MLHNAIFFPRNCSEPLLRHELNFSAKFLRSVAPYINFFFAIFEVEQKITCTKNHYLKIIQKFSRSFQFSQRNYSLKFKIIHIREPKKRVVDFLKMRFLSFCFHCSKIRFASLTFSEQFLGDLVIYVRIPQKLVDLSQTLRISHKISQILIHSKQNFINLIYFFEILYFQLICFHDIKKRCKPAVANESSNGSRARACLLSFQESSDDVLNCPF